MLCSIEFDSKLATFKIHATGKVHKELQEKADARQASRQRGLDMYGADAVARREDAAISEARQKLDPATASQMACLLNLVRVLLHCRNNCCNMHV
jgi:hypothetical protein